MLVIYADKATMKDGTSFLGNIAIYCVQRGDKPRRENCISTGTINSHVLSELMQPVQRVKVITR